MTAANFTCRPGVRVLLAAAILLLPILNPPSVTADEGTLDQQTRVGLQMTLKTYIEGNTKDGTYPFFDVESGAVQNLKLKSLHPVIFKREDHFMMCADFVGEDGGDVLIDYIVVPREDGYVVEQQILGRRSYLKTLFDRVF